MEVLNNMVKDARKFTEGTVPICAFIQISDIIKLCQIYDEVYDVWPESKFEGESVRDFILEQIEAGMVDILSKENKEVDNDI